MQIVRVSTRGRIVIPADLRRRHDIKKGTRVIFEDRGNEIIVRPANRRFYEQAKGIVKGKKSLTKVLLEERARDKAKEDQLPRSSGKPSPRSDT